MPRIFIVDDEPFILKALTRMLRASGFQVQGFSTVADALTAMASPPDLVLTDYHLPELDGLDLATRCHAIAPETPVVVLSGGVLDERIEAALQAGLIRRFLRKPWDQAELLQTLWEQVGPRPAAAGCR